MFRGTGPLFLGLELEVATGRRSAWDCAETASTWLGALGYLKADDSIGGGFEIVTHPMTYPWALAHFPWRMLPALETAGAAATARTGLHVHLSRAGFDGCCHTYRWMKFIHRNRTHVVALARRDDSQWAQFHDDDRAAVKDYAKGRHGDYRYRAINTLNADTFELRTVPDIVRRDAWGWPAFTAWIARRAEYTALAEELAAIEAGVTACAC